MFYYCHGRNNLPLPRGYLMEKADAIVTTYEWGRWFQTVYDVNIEINLPPEVVAKNLSIRIKTNQLNCKLKKGSKTLLKGKLHGKVKVDESSWTFIEDRHIVRVVLSKIITSVKDNTWEGLFKNEYLLDPETALKVRNRIDMERFQLEECY